MEALSRAKESGAIRAHGVSCHTLSALELAAKTEWVDVELARINPAGVAMDADPATVISVLTRMKTAGKGVRRSDPREAAKSKLSPVWS